MWFHYNDCPINFAAQIRQIRDAPLRETLKKLGGWPVVEGTDWKPPRDAVEVLLGRLRGDFNEGVLLEQWVGPDDKNSSANILQVRRQSKTVLGDPRFFLTMSRFFFSFFFLIFSFDY